MRRLALSVVAALLLCGGLAACEGEEIDSTAAASRFVASTTSGAVRGFTRDGHLVWRGIPYAEPPVGDQRWRPPAEPGSWEGVRDATAYGHACLQGERSELSRRVAGEISDTDEDCLYLNVTRPSTGASSLPVMVWLHGGGFTSGTGGLDLYNSPGLVDRGVVLVTLNYRLGRLGFFAHPALTAESGEQVANFGLLDQVRALEWVRDNIASFGGDPDDVTVFGESAGGVSVNALMASPRAEGLFQRAVVESGLGREPSQPFGRAEAEGGRIASSLGLPAATADQLRAVPGDQLAALRLDILEGQVPVVDDVLPKPVAQAFADGDEAAVPYLVGTNDLEVPDTFFTSGGRDPDEVRDGLLGAAKPDAVAAYGGEAELDQHLMSDVIFTEPARYLALAHAARAPTYLYRFSIVPESLLATLGGAPHALEIPYVFGEVAGKGYTVPNAEALARTIGDYWVSFASTGDPTHDGAPAWDAVGDGRVMLLTTEGPQLVADDPWRARLDVVEEGYERGS